MKLNAEAPVFVPQFMHLAAPSQGWDDESIYFEVGCECGQVALLEPAGLERAAREIASILHRDLSTRTRALPAALIPALSLPCAHDTQELTEGELEELEVSKLSASAGASDRALVSR